MEYTKTVGPFQLDAKTNGDGTASVVVSLAANVGGGQASGVVKVKGSLEADVNEAQLLELGFGEVNKIVPESLQGLAKEGEAAAEAAIGKL